MYIVKEDLNLYISSLIILQLIAGAHGVNGYVGHAVKHVVMEQEMLLESVIIPHLFTEGMNAKELISTMRCATTLTAVLVSCRIIIILCVQLLTTYFI